MQHHRFLDLMKQSAPSQDNPVPPASGFVPCPMMLLPGYGGAWCVWQQMMIYQMAHQQAQRQSRTHLPTYDFDFAWN
jgi:hypothetical protein